MKVKKMIENYVLQLGELTGVQYHITWEYVENTESAEETERTEGAVEE